MSGFASLRRYQAKAVDDIHTAFDAGNRRVLLMAPTGSGKTVMFSEMAHLAAAAGTSTCIIVHRDTLLQQASAKLRAAGVQHSIIAPGRRYFGDRVCVASVQTLVRRLDRYEFDFLIPDEAHHAVSPTYRRVFDRWPDAHVLGVTATPIRADGQGLNAVFQHMTLGPPIAALIADGYLVEPIAYGPSRAVDLSAVRTRGGEYDQRELADAMDRSEVTGDAVEHYARLCAGKSAVVFCVNIKHAQDVAADFARAGFRAACIHGKMPLAEIRRLLAAFALGELQVLASCDLVSEGFDVPGIAVVIQLRPTKSLAVNLQQVGRGLRPACPVDIYATAGERRAAIAASAKPHAVVLDHAGNCFRHGMADDEREWTLEGRAKRRVGAGVAAVPVRQCPECYLCHKPADACPGCGHVYVVLADGPDQVAGELVAIDKEALRRARSRMIAEARSYDQLKDVARRLGYSSRWAWRMFCERGGAPAHA